MVQEVSGSVGQDVLTVKSYSTDEMMTMSEPEIQEIQVSSIITKARDEDNSEDISEALLAAYNSYVGSVEYRVLADKYYYYTLDIYYDIVDESEVDDYELHADKNMMIGILAGAIAAAVGVYLEAEILEVIVAAMGGAFASGKLTKNVSGVFKGTKYDCNLMAETEAGRSKTYSGASFDGKAKKLSGSWKNVKAYEGYYPQFIREKDTGVASWLFDDFFTGTFDVYRWNSEI